MKTTLLSPTPITSLIICGLLFIANYTNEVTAAPPEASQPSPAARESVSTTMDSTTVGAAKSAATTARDAIGDAWENSKNATFKQREAVRERMKIAEASLDAKIVEWDAKKDAVKDDAKDAVAAAHKARRSAIRRWRTWPVTRRSTCPVALRRTASRPT